LAGEGKKVPVRDYAEDVVALTFRGKQVKPKTMGQKFYFEALRKHDIVFGIGPAGTGKTYVAMAHAVNCLKTREVSRLVLTRPAVEAGEKLGFLPGDLQDKVDPYLRPLYDALYDILGVETFSRHMEKGIIEVAPLAYMRGRTLDDAYVILDEAQNTTSEQMKMFLTRLGFGSRAVVTGDLTQVDLPKGRVSGLEEARHILSGVEGIAFAYLTHQDVVRHALVQKIIQAYDRTERAGE
jgi:phosphate starvation-inducible PhoH-like protein